MLSAEDARIVRHFASVREVVFNHKNLGVERDWEGSSSRVSNSLLGKGLAASPLEQPPQKNT